MLYLGIDGCRGGWMVVGLDDAPLSTHQPAAHVSLVDDLSEIFRLARVGRASIVIDIPIGLPATGVRACDIAARRLLSGRHASSVFNAPVRAALAAVGRPPTTDRQREEAYQRACRLSERASGLRLSRQSFHLLPRIAEVDRWISPSLQARVHEGHPEVIFQMLAGRPLATGKKTAAGLAERVGLLERAGVAIDVDRVRTRVGRDMAGPDDVVDAAACAVAARRVALGDAVVLPRRLNDRVRDKRRLRMEIVA